MSNVNTHHSPHGDILVVEDDPAGLKFLSEILTEAGYRVRPAGDGELALRSVQAQLPDLILLDINLPGIDGIEVCDRLKADPATRDLPVIFISAHGNTDFKVKALEAGGIDYVTKPIEPSEVLARIGTHLNMYRLQRRLAVQSEELIAEIEERKQADKALRESEERYREIVEGTDDLITGVDRDGRFTYVNHMAETVLGVRPEKCIGMSAFDFVHPDDKQRTETAFAVWVHEKRHSVTFENRQVNQVTGEIREMLWSINLSYNEKGDLTGINNIARDLTDRRKLEEALLKTKRLESLGTLAGGIAHDFNNLLSIILGNLSLLRNDIEPERGSFEYLLEAENALLRASDLTTRLITFSKGGDPVKKVMSVGAFVKKSVQSTLGGSGTDGDISVPGDLFPVEIDEAQMKQVIGNMVINAHEAMDGKGVVRVCCENVTVGDKDPLQIEEGKYVKISIKDQGVGISEENLGKIFDPYFSTKERGTEKGMGLGLSVCHSVVERHNGRITVESELGAGTTLCLYLPASEKEIAEPKPLKEDILKQPIGGSGRLLVMDDEEMIRKLAINRLSRLGYDVEVAGDGAESIELYSNAKDSGKPFDVVILDLTIQMGMGGKETIQKLHGIDPDVRGIVSTGYTNDPVVTHYREYGFRGALTKPYSTYELSRVLHDVIAENP